MIRYLTMSAALAAVLASGAAYHLKTRNAALRADLAGLEREIAVRDRTIAQAREARAVADALAEANADRAKELSALKDTLRGVGDEPLPDWFRAYLRSLFPGG